MDVWVLGKGKKGKKTIRVVGLYGSSAAAMAALEKPKRWRQTGKKRWASGRYRLWPEAVTDPVS